MIKNRFKYKKILTYRLCLLVTMVIVSVLGLASKFYKGPGYDWVNGFAGDIFYETFWICAVVFVWPELSPAKVSGGVFFVTCLVEFLQLWKPPFLQVIRATFAGKLLLGTTFVWADFPYYFIGCFLTWLWLRYLHKKLLLANFS
ncbi:DUF2809 domain-containing protein [Ancylothrix sp. C2]|uniref:ribosomal maturation YjgA family protein n=1 Tax=Ancylothrix sp. D3o TaxID=2953691 RepID=UPI0021BB39E4|nr:DUF2809 domain-containing protein [Ancylothrix sp. D3o]MCT7948942.1 DUF2809 domain-containing protein [Ancylothrix sp. D3o]